MVIHFSNNLQQALENIQNFKQIRIPVYALDQVRSHQISDEVIAKYGEAKWAVIDFLNEEYGEILLNKFNLHHWLEKNKEDEIAYFLNEAGSNSLNYSEYLAPSGFHLWLGKKGFVIGIEQKGKGFNAIEVDTRRTQVNQGGGFAFFRECRNKIFFDNAMDAKIVYFEVKF